MQQTYRDIGYNGFGIKPLKVCVFICGFDVSFLFPFLRIVSIGCHMLASFILLVILGGAACVTCGR